MAETNSPEETEAPAEAPPAPAPAPVAEPKVMCFVSKDMVPESQTVEIEYTAGKPVRVARKYVKYPIEA